MTALPSAWNRAKILVHRRARIAVSRGLLRSGHREALQPRATAFSRPNNESKARAPEQPSGCESAVKVRPRPSRQMLHFATHVEIVCATSRWPAAAAPLRALKAPGSGRQRLKAVGEFLSRPLGFLHERPLAIWRMLEVCDPFVASLVLTCSPETCWQATPRRHCMTMTAESARDDRHRNTYHHPPFAHGDGLLSCVGGGCFVASSGRSVSSYR